MRICIIAEGCYPYYTGGVSSWINSIIKSFPNIEFVLLTVVANRDVRGKFAYELPENLTEVYETYLEDVNWDTGKRKKKRLSHKQFENLRSMMLDKECDWRTIFEMFHKREFSVDELLMGEDFLLIVQELYDKNYPEIVFSDFLWTLRSIYLPMFLVMQSDVPKADLYHCVATGYSGLLGAIGKIIHGGRMMISEHGIYTREREEELIKATWVQSIYKSIWINQFRRLSQTAYDTADLVTSLYEHARELQLELGCPEAKTRVTPNGVDVEKLSKLPGKLPEDEGFINVGAVLRIAPIKDVKTMISAFSEAKRRVPNLKLWIMGPADEDSDYAQECYELVRLLELSDVVFTGRIDIKDYLGRMDIMLLTSISEGQPLTILEGFAARKPIIATDVGNCRGIIYGEAGDELGTAGILCHIMNVGEIGRSIAELAMDPKLIAEMGEIGFKRVMLKYRVEQMRETYKNIYMEMAEKKGCVWTEEPFRLTEAGKEGD